MCVDKDGHVLTAVDIQADKDLADSMNCSK